MRGAEQALVHAFEILRDLRAAVEHLKARVLDCAFGDCGIPVGIRAEETTETDDAIFLREDALLAEPLGQARRAGKWVQEHKDPPLFLPKVLQQLDLHLRQVVLRAAEDHGPRVIGNGGDVQQIDAGSLDVLSLEVIGENTEFRARDLRFPMTTNHIDLVGLALDQLDKGAGDGLLTLKGFDPRLGLPGQHFHLVRHLDVRHLGRVHEFAATVVVEDQDALVGPKLILRQ